MKKQIIQKQIYFYNMVNEHLLIMGVNKINYISLKLIL